MHLRGKGVGKGRHSVNGILGEIITVILGCGNGQLEEVRGQLYRNSFKYFVCFWGRIQCWDRNAFQFTFFAAPYYLGLTSLWLSFLTCKNGASGNSLLSFRGVGWQRLCFHKHVVFNLVWMSHPVTWKGRSTQDLMRETWKWLILLTRILHWLHLITGPNLTARTAEEWD